MNFESPFCNSRLGQSKVTRGGGLSDTNSQSPSALSKVSIECALVGYGTEVRLNEEKPGVEKEVRSNSATCKVTLNHRCGTTVWGPHGTEL